MQFLVSTHAFLISLETDESFNILDGQILNKGHHYGIGISYTDPLKIMAKGGQGI